MKVKGWGIPPFLPTAEPFQNMSSRTLKESPSSPIPRFRLEIDKPVDIYYTLPIQDKSIWITFTNTGKYTLHDLKPNDLLPPFSMYGGIPRVLRPGESFKLKFKFEPSKPRKHSSTLVLNSKEASFRFPLAGEWACNVFTYNGLIRHNGKYHYGGTCSVITHKGSIRYNGKYRYGG